MEHPVAEYECLSCGHTDYRMTTKPVGDLVPNSCPECSGDLVIESRGVIPKGLEKIVEIIDKHFYIWDFVVSSSKKEFYVEDDDLKDSFNELLDDLDKEGYQGRMDEGKEEIKLSIEKAPEIEDSNILINLVLFIATICTTFGIAGYWYLYEGSLLMAALFSSSLLTILGIHEMGHKIFTWKNEVDSTWPYFLPIPVPLLGTFGAVMRNKSPIPSKEALVEIGSAGPILGFLFTIPICLVGLHYSSPVGAQLFSAPFENIPTPFLYYLFTTLFFEGFPPTLDLHPLAWSGFIGIYVTWLNLLPAGQLDGGHVVRSIMSEDRHMDLTLFLIILFIFLGLLIRGNGLPFLVIGFIILFFLGNPHPGALDDVTEINKTHKILVGLTFVVFILCFPIPI